MRVWWAANRPAVEELARQRDAEVYLANEPVALPEHLWAPGRRDDDDIDADDAWSSKTQSVQPTTTMLASVSGPRGKLLWLVFSGKYGGAQQRSFLQAVVAHTRRRTVFLVKHKPRAYTGERVRSLLGERRHRTGRRASLHLLPPLPRVGEASGPDEADSPKVP
jgi:hypothetical protein